ADHGGGSLTGTVAARIVHRAGVVVIAGIGVERVQAASGGVAGIGRTRIAVVAVCGLTAETGSGGRVAQVRRAGVTVAASRRSCAVARLTDIPLGAGRSIVAGLAVQDELNRAGPPHAHFCRAGVSVAARPRPAPLDEGTDAVPALVVISAFWKGGRWTT